MYFHSILIFRRHWWSCFITCLALDSLHIRGMNRFVCAGFSWLLIVYVAEVDTVKLAYVCWLTVVIYDVLHVTGYKSLVFSRLVSEWDDAACPKILQYWWNERILFNTPYQTCQLHYQLPPLRRKLSNAFFVWLNSVKHIRRSCWQMAQKNTVWFRSAFLRL